MGAKTTTVKVNGELYQVRRVSCGSDTCKDCKSGNGHKAIYQDTGNHGTGNGPRWMYVKALPDVDPDYQVPTCQAEGCSNPCPRRGQTYCSQRCRNIGNRALARQKKAEITAEIAGRAERIAKNEAIREQKKAKAARKCPVVDCTRVKVNHANPYSLCKKCAEDALSGGMFYPWQWNQEIRAGTLSISAIIEASQPQKGKSE